jgi:hypothetical protein
MNLLVLLCLPLITLAGITSFWDMTPIGQGVLDCLFETGYL